MTLVMGHRLVNVTQGFHTGDCFSNGKVLNTIQLYTWIFEGDGPTTILYFNLVALNNIIVSPTYSFYTSF